VGILGSDESKFLFVREHTVKESDSTLSLPAGRTLFVANVAFDCTEEDLRNILEPFGAIEAVHFGSLEASGKAGRKREKKEALGEPDERQKVILAERLRMQAQAAQQVAETEKQSFLRAGVAYVVFNDRDAIRKGLRNLAPVDFHGKVERGEERKGLKKYVADHKAYATIDADELQRELDAAVFEFDRRSAELQRQVEALTETPDADGWITVAKKGKKKAGPRGHRIGVATITAADIARLKEKERSQRVTDLYRFQKDDRRKKYLMQLRDQFEADKRRIERMKQSRQFNPD